MVIPSHPTHQEYRITELVRSIATPLQLGADPVEQRIARECAHQLVVALAPLMHTRHQSVNHAETRVPADALGGQSRARRETVGFRGCVLQGAQDGSAQRHDPTPTLSGSHDRPHRRLGKVVRLVQRKSRIQPRIAGR